jgi:PhzF family phenazine biosynthesis protein
MEISMYQVDAFTDRRFAGNPAAVCPLEEWLPDSTMQAIAEENSLSETAFFVAEESDFRLRWFTPVVEVDLCGHATLASAYVILEHLDRGREQVVFETRSGRLAVTRDGDLLVLDFPSYPAASCEEPAGLIQALGREPEQILLAHEYMAVYADQEAVAGLSPDMRALQATDAFGVIVTAPGEECDFVSRFFAPAAGIPEDPVTGSAHCALTPYWSARLGKRRLRARQISARGGELYCEDQGDRVAIAGRATLYLEGRIFC